MRARVDMSRPVRQLVETPGEGWRQLGFGSREGWEAGDSTEEPPATLLPERLGGPGEVPYQSRRPGEALPCTHTAPWTPEMNGPSQSPILKRIQF